MEEILLRRTGNPILPAYYASAVALLAAMLAIEARVLPPPPDAVSA